MSFTISRDAQGVVTITNPRTGETRVLAGTTQGPMARAAVKDSIELPSHKWSSFSA